jgi:hypothetical protein
MITPSLCAGLRVERRSHRRDHALPTLHVLAQPHTAGRRERVETRAAIVLGDAPFGGEQPAMLEPVERGVHGALFDAQRAAGDLLDAQKDAIAMEGSERHCVQDEEIEGAGEKRRALHALLRR